MYLLIDWGNTALKYLLVSDLSVTEIERANLHTCETPQQISQASLIKHSKAIICSVRSEQDNQLLEQVLCTNMISTHWARTTKTLCNITCAYQDPDKLGVDRWMAVVGAQSFREMKNKDRNHYCVGIIDIGSAITVDLVTERQHLGGQIVPGDRLLRDGLKLTARVKPSENEAATDRLLGDSTASCVETGLNLMLASYLSSVIEEMSAQYQVETWYLCGGGGEFWSQKFKLAVSLIYAPKIIFHGLALWFSENGSISD